VKVSNGYTEIKGWRRKSIGVRRLEKGAVRGRRGFSHIEDKNLTKASSRGTEKEIFEERTSVRPGKKQKKDHQYIID